MAPKAIDTGASDAPVYTGQVGGPSVASKMLSPSVAGAAYEGLGRLGEQLSGIGETIAQPLMEDKGSQSVTRDPGTGELTVQTRPVLTSLDQAFNHGAQASFMVQSEGDRRTYLQQLAIQHIDDPDTFRDLATKYVKTQAGGTGVPSGLRTDILTTGLGDVNQFTQNLATKKQERDVLNQRHTVNSGIKDTANDLYALAHNLATDTPEFAAGMGKLKNQLNTFGGNPLLGTPGEAQDKQDEIVSNVHGEVALGHALAEAKANGPDSGRAFLEKTIWDPALDLSVPQREAFERRGHAEINQWVAGQNAADTQLRQSVEVRIDDAIAKAGATGDRTGVISPNDLYKAFAKDPARAADISGRINAAADLHSYRQQVATATPAQLADILARANPANQTGPKGGFDAYAKDFLFPHEGGYTASDGNGHPSNFGINQGSNPDVNVKDLTAEAAAKIHHDRYWVPSGADKLPPQLAAVQGDTAINMGVGAANELLAKSGGNPDQYLNLRADRYKAIAAANPEKAANLPTWLQRNEDLRTYITQGSFAAQERTYTAALQAVHERQEALGRDPTAYTVSVRPDIAAHVGSDDPHMVQVGIPALLAAQRVVGVMAPKILGVGQATQIVQSFNNPQDTNKRADAMNQTIDGLAQRYGSYFPQVMSELQAKGMPPEASALYAVRGMGVPAVRMATAINSMSKMGKDLNEGRDKFFAGAPNNSEIRKAIPGVMGDYAGTLQGSADGPQQTAAMTNAVSLYARQLAYEGVTDPNRAAQQAHDDLIGSRYNFVDSYRVPKGIDQSMIQRGANGVKMGLGAANLEPYANAAPGVSVNERRAMSAKILSQQGRWVTRADDKGLVLVWPQATGYLPAIDRNGKPISFSWAALQSAGQKNYKPTDEEVTLGQAMGN